MKIEVLYPEIANLFGDHFNIKYLAQCLPKCEIIETNLTDEPYFVNHEVKMIYLGPMTEANQIHVIDRLKPHQEKIKALIKAGVVFLVTGNALEIFGDYILDGKNKIAALGIFNTYAARDFDHRHNSLFLGEFDGIKIVGYKSQFTHGFNNQQPFIKVIRGCGFNPEETHEGIHEHNFFGTYLLGPILVINPLFTKKILTLLGVKPILAFEEAAIAAYRTRLKEYEDEKVSMVASH